MTQCAHFERCPFLRKWGGVRNAVTGGFMQLYCRDAQGHGCKRLEYRHRHGTYPSDDMLPNGRMHVQD